MHLLAAILLTLIPPQDGRTERSHYVSSLLKEGAIGAEIGVDEGVFAYHVLLQKEPARLWLIDPWEYGLQRDLEKDITLENQRGRDEQYQRVCAYFSPYENVSIMRAKAEDVASQFPDGYFDYVYIDGEHSYEAITRDLSNYFPKVKAGGLLIGDDYGWTGIAPAVQEFLKKQEGSCLFLPNVPAGQFVIRRLR